MSEQNRVRDLSFNFALDIMSACKELFRINRFSYPLVQQLLKSGTSIGANIEEALAGQSQRDFIAKMYIAIKEPNETRYWLKLVNETLETENIKIENLIQKSTEPIALLCSITKTTRANIQKK